MPFVPASKRSVCPACLRPQSACICRWVTPVAHPVEVLILQHPLEAANPKGSARLLHLSLPRSRLVTGEVFDPQSLTALLTGPFDRKAAAGSLMQAILLYPDTSPGETPRRAAAAPATRPVLQQTPGGVQPPDRLRLVVLDGTWRKSRKMLCCNPLLQQLPRLALHNMPDSRYRIRKAHRPDQLSTLEATCAALAQLHGTDAALQPLRMAFDRFVAWQMGLRIPGGTDAA